MKKIIILIILLTSFKLNAQNILFEKTFFPNKKKELSEAKRNIKLGDSYFDLGEGMYESALEFYLPAQAFNPNNALLNYKIGKSYLNTNKKHNAFIYIETAFKLDSIVAEDIFYMLGQILQLKYEFDKSIHYYNEYKKILKKNIKDNIAIIKEVDKRIKESNSGKDLVAHPRNVTITNLGGFVNTKHPDYKPIINADESVLIFTSRRENTKGGQKDLQDSMYYEDIYITTNQKGEWSTPINPDKPLNTEFHDAAMGISPDGQRMLVYKGENGGDIFECRLEGDKWSEPVALGKNVNTEFKETSAAYSFDGRTVYYASDKTGGYGGKDIYMVKADKKGKWGIPKNLGKTINTPFDELGVFMHPDGKTIYFSSKGHNTMGGFDIFQSVYENGAWEKPKNIGYPINTTDDDVFFSISASGLHAYYSSAKPGGFGEQDIYKITFNIDKKDTLSKDTSNIIIQKSNQLTILKGMVMDEITLAPLKAIIEITDNVKNEVVSTFESNSITGKYLVSLPSGTNYGIAVLATGYLFHSENFDIPATTDYREIVKHFKLKKVEIGSTIVLNNIFFDFDKATIRVESIAELDRLVALMKDNSNISIEISGHTDNKGTSDYNKKLSENRAKAVVDYLILKGVLKNRLVYAGYGFEKPIATNDTEEGRQLNRRTEFKIIKK